MYLKLIEGACLFALSTAFGLMKSEKLKERTRMLGELKKMTVFLQGELRFHRSVLSEALESISSRAAYPLDGFLKEVSEKLEKKEAGFEEVWTESVEKLFLKETLWKEDRSLFLMLGNSLGYLDVAMQLEHLNLVILQVEESLKQAKEQQEIKGKLYRTMGAAAGAFFVLLII